MPQIIVLPHEELCPEGSVIEGKEGVSVLDNLLKNGVDLEHACEKSCACTTCHIYVREGGDSLEEATDTEEDYLDKAWGVDPDSRLSCQTIVDGENLVVEIPKYTINMVSENH